MAVATFACQLMEHLLFLESSLHSHVISKSNEKLSCEMIEVLLERRCKKKSQQIMQDVFFGSLELELLALSILTERNRLWVFKDDSRRSSFLTICLHTTTYHRSSKYLERMRAGVQLGMYRYLWSEVYCAGIFKCFLQAAAGSFENSRTLRMLGRKLRVQFLEPGATFDTDKTLREFDGCTLGSAEHLFELYSFNN